MGARTGKRRLGLVTLVVSLVALPLAQPSGSAAEDTTIEAASGGGGFIWKPSTASVEAGGSVAFKNPSAGIPHGVTWTGGPEEPSCPGVAIEGEKTSWSGTCTFTQPGSYTFVCTVHPTEMKGTVTVGSGDGGPPPGGEAAESPLRGGAPRALHLAKNQHGPTVRGSIALTQAGAGAGLEVTLASRGRRVGGLARSQLKAGRTHFEVNLRHAARQSLEERGRLHVGVRIVLRPPGAAALTLRRGVVLHA